MRFVKLFLAAVMLLAPVADAQTILRQSTEIEVRVGPFMDVGDAATPETSVSLGSADQAEVLKADGVSTVSISAATWSAVTGCDGYYDLTLTTSHTDTVGELMVVIQDASEYGPVRLRYQVVEEDVYDGLFAAGADLADQADITGGAYALDTDANGRVRVVDGTGTGEIDTASGKVSLTDGSITSAVVGTGALDADAFANNALHADVLSSGARSDIEAAALASSVSLGLDHLLFNAATGADIADDTIFAQLVSGNLTADWDDYTPSSDSLSAIHDRLNTRVPDVISLANINNQLDISLADYDGPTNAEMVARTRPTADYFDQATDQVIVTTNNDKTGYSITGTVAANVTQFEGHALAGTGTQIADGFEAFFDVGTPSKDMNDVGVAGSGITAQEVRDAMKLAPTAGAPAAGSVDEHLDDILADSSAIGAAGAGLTGIPWNSAWDAEVQSEATDAINAYDGPTKAELDSGLAGLNDLSEAQVNSQLDISLADYDGPTRAEATSDKDEILAVVATVDTVVDAIKVVTDDLTSVVTIANGVWNKATSENEAPGSFGKLIADSYADMIKLGTAYDWTNNDAGEGGSDNVTVTEP